jgi:hypothetical protein
MGAQLSWVAHAFGHSEGAHCARTSREFTLEASKSSQSLRRYEKLRAAYGSGVKLKLRTNM